MGGGGRGGGQEKKKEIDAQFGMIKRGREVLVQGCATCRGVAQRGRVACPRQHRHREKPPPRAHRAHRAQTPHAQEHRKGTASTPRVRT